MILINSVLFWVSIGLLLISMIALIYLLIKQKKGKILIHAYIFVGFSVIVTIMQQIGIVKGTTAGGDLSFLERYYLSILGFVLFGMLIVYMIWISFKYVRYLEKNNAK